MLLTSHPTTTASTVQSIDASLWQDGDRWHFRYLAEGANHLVFPNPALPGRADGLWQATCFEAFVGLAGPAYFELNFSPSRQWAAYRFDTPRHGMREELAEIDIWLDAGEGWFALEAAVKLPALTPGAALNLTAVIEESGGAKSYWALAHPEGSPDFHDRACFSARLEDIAQS